MPEIPAPGVDPDAVARPLHLQSAMLLAVAVGAAAGTPARYGLAVLWPTTTGGWPTGTFVTNLLGAFVLGLVLEGLARRGPDAGRRRLARLLFGTGFCGAFTTYSTLAVETDLLFRAHDPSLAITYGLASVAGGLLTSVLGIVAATRWGARPAREPA